MVVSEWVIGLVEREVDESRRKALFEALSNLDESIFGAQDLDRMAAAIIILFLEGIDLDLVIDEAQFDWRDLLMSAGLEGHDWLNVVSGKFGLPRG